MDEKTADALRRLPQPLAKTTFDDDLHGFIVIDGIHLEKKA
jgi:hypothetical protein